MTLNRAYSLITIKSVDEEQRIIEGMATTPTPDRLGDIVVSEGAEFKLPLPLLMQHNAKEPIGHVIDARVTKKGIAIKAQIARVDEEGSLKNRLTEAWQMIKSGLIGGLSIGFKSLEAEEIKDSKETNAWFPPLKHTKWLWLELSAVTIPANGEATIQTVKAIDTQQLAAIGRKSAESVRLIQPGASGKSNPKAKDTDMGTKTIAEQIASLEASRAAKQAELENVLQKSIDEGRSTDKDEQEAFDTLERELKALDEDLARFRSLEKLQMAKAKPVEAAKDAASAASVRGGHDPIIVRDLTQKVAPGIRMARVVRCLGLAQGNRFYAAQVAEQLYKHDPIIVEVMKANVVAGSTSTATGMWGSELVGTETSVFADFVEFLRPLTIIGKFGVGGVPSLRSVPFRTALIGQTTGGAGYWVGEGKAKPLTEFDFSRTTIEPLKVANIAVVTEELLRSSNPNVETIIRDQLVAALQERLDLDFINPDKALVANVSPASILNGITPIASTGNDAEAIRNDIAAIFAAFIAANNPPTSGVWVMSARTALTVGFMMNPLGQPEFPGINMNGGTLGGLPVITSEYITPNTSGDFIALVNARDIYLADEGGFMVDMSREASLEMSDAPTGDSLAPTAASLVSLWQTNSVGFRAERTINWKRRRETGVQWLNNVHWGEAVTA